ncbi:MAG: tRNA lysidine(34) synthetase TilS [Chthoniobacterales bacterium]
MEIHSPRKKYLVGVSGGRDSVALLCALLDAGFRNLVVCHFNHKLRGTASTGDAAFVRKLAKQHALPYEEGRGNTKSRSKVAKQSIETVARTMRHEFFTVCARKHRTKKIFLAHHAEDQIETCLFNYLRGTGLAGLAGMRPVSILTLDRLRLELLRPLLAISRATIDAYLKLNKLSYREDATNADLSYSRNQIRHRVLGNLEKSLGRDVRKSILRTAEILSAEEDWMQGEVAKIPLQKQLSVKALRVMPLALQRRFLRRWMIAQNVPEPDYADVAEALKLLVPEAKVAKINLPKGIHLRRRAGLLFLEFPGKR